MRKIATFLIVTLLLLLSITTTSFGGDVYEVKAGDKLWKIAQKYNTTWAKLQEHNNLKNPHLIFPKQKLLIPNSDSNHAAENSESHLQIKVKSSTGTYIGQKKDEIAEFLGIRYAAPIERWKAPKDVTTNEHDVIEALEWGASCIQPYDDVELASQWIQDEDCLTLNIWTKDLGFNNKPVMLFIHGGGATQGGSYDPLYYGGDFVRNLPAKEDAVFITINYRLGIFGSLDLSTLNGYDESYSDSVNLAILDQVQALKWVSENIEAWGGNPNNITIFGQSAGGGAVSTLLTMPQATRYFQKAIMESGMIFNRQCTPEKLKENSQIVFDILKVSTIAELMAISDDEIYEKHIDRIFEEVSQQQRVADGRIIPKDGWNALVNGSAKGIKIMIGCTDGEYDFHAMDWDNIPNPITDSSHIWGKIEKSKDSKGDASTVLSPVNYPDVVKEYLARDVDKVKRMQDLYNDIHYRQGSIYVAEALSKYTDVYMYYWTWAPDPEEVIELMGEDAEVSPYSRAMHCMDLVFVFGTIEDGYPELAGPGEKLPELLVDQTQAAYYSFAKTGNPNNELIPKWETYSMDNRYTMVIGSEWELIRDPRSEDRLILNKIRPITEKNK